MATTSLVRCLINYYDIVVNSYILRLIDVEVSEFGRGRLTHVCVSCGLCRCNQNSTWFETSFETRYSSLRSKPSHCTFAFE